MLVNKIDTFATTNPMDFHNIHLKLQNESDHTWSEFTLNITEMTKRRFQNSLRDKTYEFIIGVDQHALYVEKVNTDGDLIYCINSAGEHGDPMNKPRPRIPTDVVEDGDIWAVKLIQRSGMFNVRQEFELF